MLQPPSCVDPGRCWISDSRFQESQYIYLASCGDRTGWASTGIVWVFSSMMCSLAGSGVDTRAYVAPGTAIERFLLQWIQFRTKVTCAIYVTDLTPKEISMRVQVEVCGDLFNTQTSVVGLDTTSHGRNARGRREKARVARSG
jgi:hypothetical protein